ncbi:putative phosphoglycerate mutase family protein [Stachybotrys elegans]|uniref:Phosphoglycerate mutase family protein n=1 Tax=Stachybotrys elegans TaxID=80388 RepID=A0A8K0WT98_9HYPO|nr:putative phosphoglycerate mutase family protein [Stachybotrys elegans]
MTWFDYDSDHAQAYDQVVNRPHEAKWSHELLGGAAAYEAARQYEKHVERQGRPPSHDQAKALLAGLVGAFVDREVETKGLDYLDREKAKHHARREVEQQLAGEYNY